MVRSLLIKLAMLAAAVALAFWIGWPVPDDSGLEDGEGLAPAPLPLAPAPPDPSKTGPTVQPGDRPPKDGGTPGVVARLDVNRATAGELERLPGIGAVLAQRIVEWRRERGAFASVDDLNHVKGIGEKKLQRIKPLVMVGPAKPPAPSQARPAAAPHGKGPDAR